MVAFLLFSPPSRDRFKSRERRARPPGGSICPQPSAALPERPRRSQLTAVISAITVLHSPPHAFCSLPARPHPLQPGQERAPGPGAGARRSRRGRAGPRRAGLCRARSAILGKCDRPAGRFEVSNRLSGCLQSPTKGKVVPVLKICPVTGIDGCGSGVFVFFSLPFCCCPPREGPCPPRTGPPLNPQRDNREPAAGALPAAAKPRGGASTARAGPARPCRHPPPLPRSTGGLRAAGARKFLPG